MNKKIIDYQISQCLNLVQDVLGEDLIAIYLYGSSVVGGLQKYSDLDLFVVSKRSTKQSEKEKIVLGLLKISGVYGIDFIYKPVELTICVKSKINPWYYPPKLDFQYGDWMRKDFEKGNYKSAQSKVNPDLAIVFTQILLAHKIIFGPIPKEVLPIVPYTDFIKASTREIDNLIADIKWDTRNVLLTLARIWSTVVTDYIRTKPEAATWGIEKLPKEHKIVMQRAHDICAGKEEDDWKDTLEQAKECANFMVEQIKLQVNSLSSINRSIKILK